MSNITISAPSILDLKKEVGSNKYDYEDLRNYYAWINYKKRNGSNSEYRNIMTSRILKEYADNAGFKKWLKTNFIETPSWLKRTWSIDDDYKPIYSDVNGRYYLFNESELEYGEIASGRPGARITNNDIIHDYGKSLKDELKAKGLTLVKISNGKWRVYLNKASAPKGSAGNIASTTSKASNTSTTSSTGSNSSVSNTSNTSSISSTSPTTTTDSTTSTDPTTSTDMSTDSTTRSFDFLDDVLGTQKEASKDKTTELDPNQIANTIVSETKLNDTAISSLVSTYLNSLHRINRSYNTQTK